MRITTMIWTIYLGTAVTDIIMRKKRRILMGTPAMGIFTRKGICRKLWAMGIFMRVGSIPMGTPAMGIFMRMRMDMRMSIGGCLRYWR